LISIIYLFPYTLFLVVFSSVKDNKIIWFFLLPHPSCENSAAVIILFGNSITFSKRKETLVWVIVASLFDCGELERVIEWLVEYRKSN
jgi:hypothetical protein